MNLKKLNTITLIIVISTLVLLRIVHGILYMSFIFVIAFHIMSVFYQYFIWKLLDKYNDPDKDNFDIKSRILASFLFLFLFSAVIYSFIYIIN